MNKTAIVFVEFPGAAQRWASLRDAALSDWPEANRPDVLTLTGEQLMATADPPPDSVLAWVLCDGQMASGKLCPALDRLAGWQLPIALTRSSETGRSGHLSADGAVIIRPDDDPAAIRLILRALLSQGELIRQLKTELHLFRRQQGGLLGEIDRMDEEMRLAAGVQREFLPTQLPTIGPVEVHTFFRPASYVSGDIYDVQRLDEDHIGFWIADVVGHGVPAALLTMFIKRALPTKEISGGTYRLIRPDEALARVNAEMFEHSRTKARFATAVYGLLNCRTLQLQLARAGHPLPLLLQPDGRVTELNPEGPLLAVFPEARFDIQTVQLHRGDRLLLFSDGFEFAFGRPDADRPANAYLDRLAELVNRPTDTSLARLGRAIDRQPGSLHQHDDLTAILVHINETDR